MKLRIALAALGALLPAAAAQTSPDDLAGIYTSGTKIGAGAVLGILKPGQIVTNQVIIYKDVAKGGALRGYVNSVSVDGYSCALHGDIGNVSPASFTVSENFMGVCTLKFAREDDTLRLAELSGSCRTSCGQGGSFTKAPYRKLCSVVDPNILEEMETRFYPIDVDYGPACPKPKG